MNKGFGALNSVAGIIFILLFSFTSYAVENNRLDYKLGPGDRINIVVYGEDDLAVETVLSDSGIISYPFIGDLQVSGLTISELENLIITGLDGRYILDPNVNVSIVEYRPFFVIGEVNRPGGYPFQPGLTINKAVALANGLTERASRGKVYILRGHGAKYTRVKADLNWKILPGDVVSVEASFF